MHEAAKAIDRLNRELKDELLKQRDYIDGHIATLHTRITHQNEALLREVSGIREEVRVTTSELKNHIAWNDAQHSELKARAKEAESRAATDRGRLWGIVLKILGFIGLGTGGYWLGGGGGGS